MSERPMRDEQETAPAGILADVVSRASILAKAEEEEQTAAHLERRAAAMLQQAEQLAGLAQRARVRAEVLREIGTAPAS